ncbi:MAG: hypothetical protein QM594_22675 [Niabella sp.]|jgi:hypothetical protein
MKMWRWPIVLGALSATALAVGLLFDNVWDEVATLLLSLPVCVSIWYGWLKR